MMLKLGRLTLDVPFFQAALSGYSDYPMRKLAKSFGAPLTFAGVMLAKSAACPKVLNKPIFKPGDDEHPVGAQILGSEPKTMAKAARALVQAGYDLIDLNFACPAPKVLRRRRGGYLLKEPETVVEIFRRVRDSIDCPVLMKLRIGFDSSTASRDNFWQIVSDTSSDGLDGLLVHPRTVLQRFTGSADWQFLARLKNQFPQATIIGSGDLFDAGTAAELLRTTRLDGAAIARGAIGNPWIFSRLRAIYEGRPLPPAPDLVQQGRTILRHFEMVSRLYPPQKTVRFFRKFVVSYCKLHPHRKTAQKALLAAGDKKALVAAAMQWYGLG